MSNKEITTWKIPQEYIDQQQKIQTQDKLIEELEEKLDFITNAPMASDIYDGEIQAKTVAKQALAKIKEHKASSNK